MVQSLNTAALKTLTTILLRPSLTVPHLSLLGVSYVDYAALRAHAGIRAVAFDKDNTLTAPYENFIHTDAAFGLSGAISAFGVENVAILSNSAGTADDENFRDALEIEEALGIAVIRHSTKKPGGMDEVLTHFGLTDPAELCVVGDRLLTDVVFGNLHGCMTVHVLPLCKGADNAKDNKIAKIVRSIENAALYGNWLVGRKLREGGPGKHKFWTGEPSLILDRDSAAFDMSKVGSSETE